jgi:uncharacterized Zn-finger protein
MNGPDADTKSMKADLMCTSCGGTFSAFLREMADQNEQVTCPYCGQVHQYKHTGDGQEN